MENIPKSLAQDSFTMPCWSHAVNVHENRRKRIGKKSGHIFCITISYAFAHKFKRIRQKYMVHLFMIYLSFPGQSLKITGDSKRNRHEAHLKIRYVFSTQYHSLTITHFLSHTHTKIYVEMPCLSSIGGIHECVCIISQCKYYRNSLIVV